MCADVLTYTPTMSSVDSAITVPDIGSCRQVLSDCNSLSVSMSSCASAYTADAALSGCLCDENMLYLGSRCDIDGASCVLSTIASASVYSNQVCGPASVTAATSRVSSRLSSTTGAASPSSAYRPPTPSATGATDLPTSSASPTNQGTGANLSLTLAVLMCIVVMVVTR